MRRLADLDCTPCQGDEPPLSQNEIQELLLLIPTWEMKQDEGFQYLEKIFKFNNYAQALAFTNRVGSIAEAENHHPAILTEWGKVTVRWWTHHIGGLHRNDFILAARTDQLGR